MPDKPQYTVKQMVQALNECKGMVTYAARRLGCSVRTVENYCTRHAAVRQARDEARSELLDAAELTIWNAIQRGDVQASMFVLRMLGHARGYVVRTEDKLEAHVVTGTIAEWEQRLQAAHSALEARRKLAMDAEYKALPEGHSNGSVPTDGENV